MRFRYPDHLPVEDTAPMNTKPEHPYFYKYMTAHVAKLILVNRKVRYSAPSRFNDPFDTQIDLHFPFELEELREPLMERFLDIANGRTPLPTPGDSFNAWVLKSFRGVRDKIDMTDEEIKR